MAKLTLKAAANRYLDFLLFITDMMIKSVSPLMTALTNAPIIETKLKLNSEKKNRLEKHSVMRLKRTLFFIKVGRSLELKTNKDYQCSCSYRHCARFLF